MVEERTKAQEVRSHIMLPTGESNDSRIVTYGHGYRSAEDADSNLRLSKYGGCSGRCLRDRSPKIADLEEAKRSFADWEMTEDQQARVAQDRKSMLSFPVWGPISWTENLDPRLQDAPIWGILSIDSSTSLADTEWVAGEVSAQNSKAERKLVEIMVSWAGIISKLLRV